MTTVNNLSGGFLYLYDWLPAVEALTGEEFKALFVALVKRQRDGEPIPPLPGRLTQIFAAMIEPTISRRLAGQKGGNRTQEKAARNEERKEEEAPETGSEPLPEDGSEPLPEDGSVLGTQPNKAEQSKAEQRKEELCVTPSPKRGCGGESDAEFKRFFRAYPKKKRKEGARQVFRRLSVDEALLERMLAAIERQKRSEQWTRDEGRYIPYPDTWLLNGQWEDEEAEVYNPEVNEDNFDTEEFFTAALIRSYGYDPREAPA